MRVQKAGPAPDSGILVTAEPELQPGGDKNQKPEIRYKAEQ